MNEATAQAPIALSFAILVELLLVMWLISPNLALWLMTPDATSSIVASILVTLGFLSLPALLFRSRRALYLANAPWALLAGFLSTYIVLYQAPISSGMMQSFFLTDWREASEQIARYFWPGTVILMLFALYLWGASRRPSAPLRYRSAIMAMGLWSVVGFIYLPYVAFEAYNRLGLTLETQFFQQAYPVNILQSGYEAVLAHRQSTTRVVHLPGVPALSTRQRHLFILIVGESTRAQSFSQVGRESGFFRRYPGLIYFRDTLAQANYTNASVPMLMSGAKSLQEMNDRPSLIDWQNAAGCLTAIVSNNTSYDVAQNAAVRDVVGDAGVTHHTRYDHDMLPAVDGIIATSAPRNLCLVLHMAGSHFDYTARYRDEFARYPLDGDDIEQMRAAYLNSVVMVQDFIARLIERLQSVEGLALLAYTSDHGENLMEIEGLREHVTLRPTRYELQVPLLFWANEAYRQTHKDKWNQLGENRMLPVTNAELLPTLIDAMDLPDRLFSTDQSLMRGFVPHERFFIHPSFERRSEWTLLDEGEGMYGVKEGLFP